MVAYLMRNRDPNWLAIYLGTALALHNFCRFVCENRCMALMRPGAKYPVEDGRVKC